MSRSNCLNKTTCNKTNPALTRGVDLFSDRSLPAYQSALVLGIGIELLKGIKIPPLKGNYKKAYNLYVKKINQSLKQLKKDAPELYEKAKEDTEDEKMYIECFCRFIQDESNFEIVGKTE